MQSYKRQTDVGGTSKSRVFVNVVSLSVVVFPSLILMHVMGSYVHQFVDHSTQNASSEPLIEVQGTTDAGQIRKFREQTNSKNCYMPVNWCCCLKSVA